MAKKYTVTIEVKTVYHVTVEATCVAKAEKLANQLQTSWIRANGELIDVTSEVVEVDPD